MEILVNPNSPDDFTGGKFHRPKKTSAAVLDFWIGCELPVVAGRTVTTSRTTHPIDIQYPPVIPLEYIGVWNPKSNTLWGLVLWLCFWAFQSYLLSFRVCMSKSDYIVAASKKYISYWQTIRTWKVDGVTPMCFSLNHGPLQNATFWEWLAIDPFITMQKKTK